MSRESKFRAWDKRSKKMFPVLVVDFAGAEIRKGEPSIIVQENDGYLLLKDVELMQFTGLVDKNGKEIYEGDIIIGGWFYTTPTIIEDLRTYYYQSVEFCPPENTEVIGNIYQNPYLISQK